MTADETGDIPIKLAVNMLENDKSLRRKDEHIYI
jgi:hypothetical protein